jgi:hypothetical protein
METTQLIKQETIFSLESSRDFAKWKLIVASGLAAAGLGLYSFKAAPSLLLLIPFACAYVDLYSYQDLIRVTVVSRFFQEYKDDQLLAAWEEHCQKLHTDHGVWDLAHHAQLGGSLVLSLAPVVTIVKFLIAANWRWLTLSLLLWVVGMLLIIGLWLHYRSKLTKVSKAAWDDKAGKTGGDAAQPAVAGR